jgi:hypothetical protein
MKVYIVRGYDSVGGLKSLVAVFDTLKAAEDFIKAEWEYRFYHLATMELNKPSTYEAFGSTEHIA